MSSEFSILRLVALGDVGGCTLKVSMIMRLEREAWVGFIVRPLFSWGELLVDGVVGSRMREWQIAGECCDGVFWRTDSQLCPRKAEVRSD